MVNKSLDSLWSSVLYSLVYSPVLFGLESCTLWSIAGIQKFNYSVKGQGVRQIFCGRSVEPRPMSYARISSSCRPHRCSYHTKATSLTSHFGSLSGISWHCFYLSVIYIRVPVGNWYLCRFAWFCCGGGISHAKKSNVVVVGTALPFCCSISVIVVPQLLLYLNTIHGSLYRIISQWYYAAIMGQTQIRSWEYIR